MQTKPAIRNNRAALLKEKFDQDVRQTQEKKQFIMKRFADINPRTNTHNKMLMSQTNFQEPAPQKEEPQADDAVKMEWVTEGNWAFAEEEKTTLSTNYEKYLKSDEMHETDILHKPTEGKMPFLKFKS